jgi:hypothetical protein
VRRSDMAKVRSSIVRSFGLRGWRSPRFVTADVARRAGLIPGTENGQGNRS